MIPEDRHVVWRSPVFASERNLALGEVRLKVLLSGKGKVAPGWSKVGKKKDEVHPPLLLHPPEGQSIVLPPPSQTFHRGQEVGGGRARAKGEGGKCPSFCVASPGQGKYSMCSPLPLLPSVGKGKADSSPPPPGQAGGQPGELAQNLVSRPVQRVQC